LRLVEGQSLLDRFVQRLAVRPDVTSGEDGGGELTELVCLECLEIT